MKKPKGKRSCLDCHACCISLPIISLNKKEDDPCPYLEIGKGCLKYGEHPEVCRSFECLWLKGHPLVEEFWRPDLCGFILWEGYSCGILTVALRVIQKEKNNSEECRQAILRFGKFYPNTFSVVKKK